MRQIAYNLEKVTFVTFLARTLGAQYIPIHNQAVLYLT